MGGSAAGAILFQACGVPPDELLVQASVEMPEDLVTGLDNWYATLCRQCPTSEGVVVRVMEGRAKKVEGNIDYPINLGKHSARCEAGLQALYHPDRIRGPLVRVGERGSGNFEEISWTDAIGRLTHQLQRLQDAGDQSAMVLATDPVGSHLGMVIERFAARFGGRHMPYEPIERTTIRDAMKRVFDQDVMPDFDIERANYILSFGADFLNTWMSPVRYARGYGEFRQGDRERGTLVHVESRFSMTAANADRWVYVRPGMDGILALSFAQVIISEELGDAAAAAALTGGDPSRLDAFEPEKVAEKTGVSSDRVHRLAEEFATNRPSLAFGGGSAAAHTNGSFNLAAIYSLNYLVGSVGQPGGIVFNPGPALNELPVAPAVASFSDWRRMVEEMKAGRVKVLMVRGADPWHGLPETVGFKDAAFDVPFIFSFSELMDDTTAMSDLILPEHNYLEGWGTDVPDPGPGYEMVGFQQPAVRPFFESRGTHLGTRGFADVLLTVAQGLGLDLGLSGDTFKDVLQDGAKRLYEMGRGSARAVDVKDYPDFQSFWNGALQNGSWRDESARSKGPAPSPRQLPQAEEPVFGQTGPGQFPAASHAVRIDVAGGRQRCSPALAPGDSRSGYHGHMADVGRDKSQGGGDRGHKRGRCDQSGLAPWQHRGAGLSASWRVSRCRICSSRAGTHGWRALRSGSRRQRALHTLSQSGHRYRRVGLGRHAREDREDRPLGQASQVRERGARPADR